jgi:hypothetical protein
VTATRLSSSPRAQTISVALGKSEAMRTLRSPERTG